VSAGVRLSVEGVSQVRADLRRFAPDLAKDVQRELAGEARRVADTARALVPDTAPLSGWARAWQGDRLRWDTGAVRAGLRGSTAKGRVNADGFTTVVAVVQKSAPGAVYEVAGRKSSGPMQTALGWRYGPASRAAWRAAALHAVQVTARIAVIVAKAEAEMDRRIRAGGGGR